MSAVADDLHDRIVNVLDELEPDALRTMLYLAERLMLGQRSYGRLDLKTDPRNWPEEQRAEIGDLLVYFAFEELKRQLSGGVRRPSLPAGKDGRVPSPPEIGRIEEKAGIILQYEQCGMKCGGLRCVLPKGHALDTPSKPCEFREQKKTMVCGAYLGESSRCTLEIGHRSTCFDQSRKVSPPEIGRIEEKAWNEKGERSRCEYWNNGFRCLLATGHPPSDCRF